METHTKEFTLYGIFFSMKSLKRQTDTGRKHKWILAMYGRGLAAHKHMIVGIVLDLGSGDITPPLNK